MHRHQIQPNVRKQKYLDRIDLGLKKPSCYRKIIIIYIFIYISYISYVKYNRTCINPEVMKSSQHSSFFCTLHKKVTILATFYPSLLSIDLIVMNDFNLWRLLNVDTTCVINVLLSYFLQHMWRGLKALNADWAFKGSWFLKTTRSRFSKSFFVLHLFRLSPTALTNLSYKRLIETSLSG